MKFGKVDDISLVDFRLPPDAPGTAATLERHRQEGAPLRLYIGGTGWTMKEWVGSVYPAGTKPRDYLRQYALQFNTIELNTTHYRIPDAELVRRWYLESTADFRFCPKVPQTISHSRDLGMEGVQITAFCEAVLGLEEKLGCCFIQLPPHFGYERLPLLERFVRYWPAEAPLAVELRHESWFTADGRGQEVFDRLAERRVSAVITDVAGRRDVLHMRVTTPTTMIRFVGNGLDPSDYSRVDEWVTRLDHWRTLGLAEAYVFTHEPDNILAPQLARYLYERVRTAGGITTRGPQFSEGDRQMSLF